MKEFRTGEDAYRRGRPTYPTALFQWLAEIAVDRRCAWDSGTGSGQAALGLADWFSKVVASDVNENQYTVAADHPHVKYQCFASETPPADLNQVDLVIAACAVHWYDLQAFYDAARRVASPSGVIAVWTYEWPWTMSESVDAVLRKMKDDYFHEYWLPESSLYLNRYQNLDFPFDEIVTPSFSATLGSTYDDLEAFLSTWSVVRRFGEYHSPEQLAAIKDELRDAWHASPPPLPLTLPLYIRAGRIHI